MNRKQKTFFAALLSLGILSSTALTHAASTGTGARLFVNGSKTQGEVYIKEDTLYAPLREVCESFGALVEWDGRTRTAWVTLGNTNASFCVSQESKLVGNRMYTPIRSIAAALGKDVYWNNAGRTALACDADFDADGYWGNFEPVVPESSPLPDLDNNTGSYSEDDVYWLARIIYAEARGESMEGKIAVGNVILNRVASGEFPNSIYCVIFDTNWGIQFEPVANGAIYCTPDEDCYEAARRALEGENIAGESLYFFNPSIASSFWIANNCKYVTTIGCHQFYI